MHFPVFLAWEKSIMRMDAKSPNSKSESQAEHFWHDVMFNFPELCLIQTY